MLLEYPDVLGLVRLVPSLLVRLVPRVFISGSYEGSQKCELAGGIIDISIISMVGARHL